MPTVQNFNTKVNFKNVSEVTIDDPIKVLVKDESTGELQEVSKNSFGGNTPTLNDVLTAGNESSNDIVLTAANDLTISQLSGITSTLLFNNASEGDYVQRGNLEEITLQSVYDNTANDGSSKKIIADYNLIFGSDEEHVEIGYSGLIKSVFGDTVIAISGEEQSLDFSSNSSTFQTKFTSQGIDFGLTSVEQIFVISDYNAVNPSGMQYADDYSANYTDRSLPDVGYVNSAIANTVKMFTYNTTFDSTTESMAFSVGLGSTFEMPSHYSVNFYITVIKL